MTKKWFSIVVLLLVLVGMLAVTADAKLRPGDPRIEKARLFKASMALDDGRGEMVAAARGFQTSSLGSAQPAVDSRGALIAQTWRDWMSNSSIGRTVDVHRPTGFTPDPAVQFSYMEKASAAASDRTRWGWAAYEATSGTFVPPGGKVVVQSDAPGSVQAGSYPKIAIDRTGTAIMGSYDFPDQAALPSNTQMHVARDGGSLVGDFGGILDGSVMSEAVRDAGGIENAETIWPTMDIYENGATTTVYLAAFENVTGSDGAVKVFRKVGWSDANPDATWSLVFTDTTFFPTQDISCSRVSTRVGVAWPKFTPAGRTAGDTFQNDVWCATSATGAASPAWTRTNITNYVGAGYRAWLEVACLFDSSDKFHVIWNGGYTDGTAFGARRCRLFHWSEHNTARIYTIFDAGWDPTLTDCVGGSNVMNVGKFSIAECDGRLYAIFTAWNWPGIDGTNPVDDCCASAAISQGANGELYLAISSDLTGNAWDAPRNISSSYAPACDTGNCVDDRWASISRYGMDDALWTSPDWSNAVSYDLGTGYAGTKYLQVWYLTDRYPGGGILATPQGPLTNNDMRWIRLACIAPVPAALLSVSPGFIGYPEFTKPSVEKQYTLTLENTGNTLLTLNSVTTFEDSAKPSAPAGWLGYSGAPASIAIASSANMTLELNNGGVVTSVNPTRLFGHLQFSYGPPAKTLNFPIEFIVADTIVYTVWDSVTTQCGIKLTVSTNGNMGNNYLGKANMGFPQPSPECDTSGGTLNPGDADIYMGDASPVIVKKNGAAYVASWAIFSNGFQSTSGFKPLFPSSTRGSFSSAGQYDGYNSGTFCTSDSLVKIEKTWWAPLNSADSCKFIIQRMRVFPYTIGVSVPNLAIGEAFDWDIPSDTGASNSADVAGTDPTHRMVYMRGFRSADTAITNHACYNNGLRYGGSALIMMHLKNCTQDSALYGGYNAANDSFVYPASGFVPEQLWANMQSTGYSNETRITDLHSVLVYKNGAANAGFTLPANDTLTIWTAMAVVRPTGGTVAQGLDSLKKEMDKAFKWYQRTGVKTCVAPTTCCIGTTGNVNKSVAEAPDLSDLSLLIAYLTQTPKPTLQCLPEANVNGSVAPAPDLSDLSLLIAYLTQTPKPTLPNCPA